MGLELREIQSPIFSEPIDFTFHGRSLYLVSWKQWFRKIESLSSHCQVSSLPYSGQVLINGESRSVSFLSSNVSRRLAFSFQNPNHQFTMGELLGLRS